MPAGFKKTVCCGCTIEFYVPSNWLENKWRTGNSFRCPNGCNLSYGDTTEDKLRRERDRLKQQVAERDDRIRHEQNINETLKRSRAAAQGQVTKLKKRAKAGVCPCCNRTFQNLASHMNNKHPDFATEQTEAA